MLCVQLMSLECSIIDMLCVRPLSKCLVEMPMKWKCLKIKLIEFKLFNIIMWLVVGIVIQKYDLLCQRNILASLELKVLVKWNQCSGKDGWLARVSWVDKILPSTHFLIIFSSHSLSLKHILSSLLPHHSLSKNLLTFLYQIQDPHLLSLNPLANRFCY